MFNLLCARNPWTASEFEKTLEDSTFDIDKDSVAENQQCCEGFAPKALESDHEARLEAKDALRHPLASRHEREIIQGESAGLPLPLGGCPMRPKDRVKKRKLKVVIWVVTRRGDEGLSRIKS